MKKRRLKVKIHTKQLGNIIIVYLPKYFYIGNIVDIEEAWEKLLLNNPAVIGFDCEKLEFIDSSAIGTLVKLFNNSVKNNIDMYIFGLRNELLKIFETTKINRVMSVVSKTEFETKFFNEP